MDMEDNVMRCIRCQWEIEGPVCLQCGYRFSDDDDHESSYANDTDEASDEVSMPDEYDLDDSFLDPRDTSELHEEDHTYSDEGSFLVDEQSEQYADDDSGSGDSGSSIDVLRYIGRMDDDVDETTSGYVNGGRRDRSRILTESHRSASHLTISDDSEEEASGMSCSAKDDSEVSRDTQIALGAIFLDENSSDAGEVQEERQRRFRAPKRITIPDSDDDE